MGELALGEQSGSFARFPGISTRSVFSVVAFSLNAAMGKPRRRGERGGAATYAGILRVERATLLVRLRLVSDPPRRRVRRGDAFAFPGLALRDTIPRLACSREQPRVRRGSVTPGSREG